MVRPIFLILCRLQYDLLLKNSSFQSRANLSVRSRPICKHMVGLSILFAHYKPKQQVKFYFIFLRS